MENVCKAEGKVTATTELATMETTSCQLPTNSITGRIGKHGQHLYIVQTTYPHSNSLLKREPSFKGISPLNKCTKRSILPFLGDASVGSPEQQPPKM